MYGVQRPLFPEACLSALAPIAAHGMRGEEGHSDARDLLGLAETAEFLGISKASIGDRRRRKYAPGDRLAPFPPPVAELKCGPVWERAQITAYAAEAERLAGLSWFERRGIDPDELLRPASWRA